MYLVKKKLTGFLVETSTRVFRAIYKEIREGNVALVDEEEADALKKAWVERRRMGDHVRPYSSHFGCYYLCYDQFLFDERGVKILLFSLFPKTEDPFLKLFEGEIDPSYNKESKTDVFYAVAMFEDEERVRMFKDDYEIKYRIERKGYNMFDGVCLYNSDEVEDDDL